MSENGTCPNEMPVRVKCDGCGLETTYAELLQTKRKSFRSAKVRLCTACQVDSLKYAQRTNWAILGIPLVLFMVIAVWQGSYHAVWVYLKMILAIIVFSPIVILIHELGHALMAKALGWQVSGVTLGAGRLLWQGRAGDILLQFRFIQMTGLTWCAPRRSGGWVPVQALFIFLSGPTVNAFAAWIGLQVYHFQSDAKHGSSSVVTGTTIWVFLNAFTALTNLLPYKTSVTGISVGSDGYQIFQALFVPATLRRRYEYARPYLQFASLRQLGEHTRAREVMAKQLGETPDDVFAVGNMSAAECEVDNYEGAVLQSRRCLDLLSEGVKLDPAVMGAHSALMPKFLEAASKCNLAYAMLRGRIGEPSEALALAKEAYDVIPWEPSIQGTYGYALALSGAPAEGLAILKANLKKLHDQPARARRDSMEIIKEVEELITHGGSAPVDSVTKLL